MCGEPRAQSAAAVVATPEVRQHRIMHSSGGAWRCARMRVQGITSESPCVLSISSRATSLVAAGGGSWYTKSAC